MADGQVEQLNKGWMSLKIQEMLICTVLKYSFGNPKKEFISWCDNDQIQATEDQHQTIVVQSRSNS